MNAELTNTEFRIVAFVRERAILLIAVAARGSFLDTLLSNFFVISCSRFIGPALSRFLDQALPLFLS
jgi:hypothetical protein